MCLSTVIVSFAADLYPGVPSHNTPLSTALLWASCNVDTVRPLRRRFFIYTLSIMVLLSLFVDLDFLASPTRVCTRLSLDVYIQVTPSASVPADLPVLSSGTRISADLVPVHRVFCFRSSSPVDTRNGCNRLPFFSPPE